jgi:hypothetical protein
MAVFDEKQPFFVCGARGSVFGQKAQNILQESNASVDHILK